MVRQRSLASTGPPGLMRPARLFAALLVGVATLGLTVPAAQAHSELDSSSPAHGAVLGSAPPTLRMSFSEGILPRFSSIILTVQHRSPRALPVAVHEQTMTAAVPSGLPAGQWVATYRAVSVDGHSISGTVSFTVCAAPRSMLSTPTGRPTPGADRMHPGAPAGKPAVTDGGSTLAPGDAIPAAAGPPRAAGSDSRALQGWFLGALALVSALAGAVGLARRRSQ